MAAESTYTRRSSRLPAASSLAPLARLAPLATTIEEGKTPPASISPSSSVLPSAAASDGGRGSESKSSSPTIVVGKPTAASPKLTTPPADAPSAASAAATTAAAAAAVLAPPKSPGSTRRRSARRKQSVQLLRARMDALTVQLRQFARFVRSRAHVLASYPHALISLALALPQSEAPHQEAMQLRAEGAVLLDAMLWLNAPALEPRLFEHGMLDDVTSCSWNASGTCVLVGQASGALCTVQAESGEPDSLLHEHSGGVRAVAWADNDRHALSGSDDGGVLLWDMQSRSAIELSGHRSAVLAVAISPDCRWVSCAGEDRSVLVWRASNGELIRSVDLHSVLHALAYSSDGGQLACGAEDGSVTVMDCSAVSLHMDELYRLVGHRSTVTSVSWSADGLLASGSRDATVRLWRERRAFAAMAAHAKGVTSVSFSSDARLLASASFDKTLLLWDVASASVLACLPGHSGAVLCCAFAPAGGLLVSGATDRTVKVWATDGLAAAAAEAAAAADEEKDEGEDDVYALLGGEGDRRLTWDGKPTVLASLLSQAGAAAVRAAAGLGMEQHTDRCTAVALSPDSSLIASASDDEKLRLWSAGRGRMLALLEQDEGPISALVFSATGRFLLAGLMKGMVVQWDVRKREVVSATMLFEHQPVTLLACGADDCMLACSSLGRFKVCRVAAPLEPTGVTEALYMEVMCAAFVEEDGGLQTVSRDGSVRVWALDARTGTSSLEHDWYMGYSDFIDSVSAAACCVKTDRIAIGFTDGTLHIWDSAKEVQLALAELMGCEGHRSKVTCLAYSPDGARLASGSQDKRVLLWDCAYHVRLSVFVMDGVCSSVAFSPCAGRLVAGDSTGRVVVMEVPEHMGDALVRGLLRLAYVQADSAAESQELHMSSMRARGIDRLSRSHSSASGHTLLSLITAEDAPAAGKAAATRESWFGLGLSELSAWYVTYIASHLHQAWRRLRRREDGSYEPRLHVINGKTYDIAQMTYFELPQHFLDENLAAAECAARSAFAAVRAGQPLDDDFVEEAARQQYDAWLRRNAGTEEAREAAACYDELDEVEKNKDRTIVRLFIRTFRELAQPAMLLPKRR
eukprot:PLAT3327.7.p1 GENE.PLAT3327.7~~PLAT3327.7.p1  ORF type:complete len:1249 (-),score=646.62 PLAT3327.7:3473-6736(-)